MAVILYRAGNSEVVNGVSCESIRIEPQFINEHLNAGWVTDPRSLSDDKAAPVIEHKEPETVKIRKKPGRKPKPIIDEAALNESHEG
jgi:hypothetical protein